MNTLSFHPLSGIPDVTTDCCLPQLLWDALAVSNVTPQPGDILVVTHKILSKAAGQVRNLSAVTPSEQAYAIAERVGKDPRLTEVILSCADTVYACDRGILIAERRDGWICCNAGVDASNAGGRDTVVLLPEDCDTQARDISRSLTAQCGFPIPVVICDTHGRALRSGTVGVAVGCFGLDPIRRYTGAADRDGRQLVSTQEAVADEIAGAATLVMGQGSEGIPAVLVRGFAPSFLETDAADLRLPKERQLYQIQGEAFSKK